MAPTKPPSMRATPPNKAANTTNMDADKSDVWGDTPP